MLIISLEEEDSLFCTSIFLLVFMVRFEIRLFSLGILNSKFDF